MPSPDERSFFVGVDGNSPPADSTRVEALSRKSKYAVSSVADEWEIVANGRLEMKNLTKTLGCWPLVAKTV